MFQSNKIDDFAFRSDSVQNSVVIARSDDTKSKEAWLKARTMVCDTCVNHTIYVTLGVTPMNLNMNHDPRMRDSIGVTFT